MILLGLLFLPLMASAQWTQDTTFVPAESDFFVEIHGIAVDPDGKVWLQPFGTSEAIAVNRDLGDDGVPDTLNTRAIYVYNPDGTPADFSPITVIEYADGTTPNDTLGLVWTGEAYEGYSGRGMETNIGNGNIIVSQYDRVYVLDYQTGKGLAMVEPGIGSLAEASSDAAGNIYVSAVVATDAPIKKYDSNLANPTDEVTLTSGFSRDFQVSEDGNTIWWAGYTGPGVLKYTKPDEFSGFGAVPDTVLRGIKAESFDIHPKTKHLWVGSGSLNDLPAEPYLPQTWYAFDYATLDEPVDSITWVAGGGDLFDQARPRALDFTEDGQTAYVGAFSAAETVVDAQKFTTTQLYTSNEDNGFEIPQGFSLEQNYPNPFNPSTTINYSLNQTGKVTLKVYDITGREVATLVNSTQSAGAQSVSFDAANLASGVYIYTLQANGLRLTNRMTLIK